MRRTWALAPAAAIVLLAGGCQAMAPKVEAHWLAAEMTRQADEDIARARMPAAGAAAGEKAPPGWSADKGAMPDWSIRAAELAEQRVIVYTGQFTVAVGDTRSAVADA